MCESKYEYNSKYQKENIKRCVIKFNINYDTEILAWISSRGNVQGSIKKLIQNEIRRMKSEEPEYWNEIISKYKRAHSA